MLDPQLIKTLAKIYHWENQNDEDDGNGGYIETYDPAAAKLTAKQRALLDASGYIINDTVNALRQTAVGTDLARKVKRLFIKAVGSGWYRGLQPIASYYLARPQPMPNNLKIASKGFDAKHSFRPTPKKNSPFSPIMPKVG